MASKDTKLLHKKAAIHATVIYIIIADDFPNDGQADRNVWSINNTVDVHILTVVY